MAWKSGAAGAGEGSVAKSMGVEIHRAVRIDSVCFIRKQIFKQYDRIKAERRNAAKDSPRGWIH
jgi:hypothetical protein